MNKEISQIPLPKKSRQKTRIRIPETTWGTLAGIIIADRENKFPKGVKIHPAAIKRVIPPHTLLVSMGNAKKRFQVAFLIACTKGKRAITRPIKRTTWKGTGSTSK
jgi:hypothetical protein